MRALRRKQPSPDSVELAGWDVMLLLFAQAMVDAQRRQRVPQSDCIAASSFGEFVANVTQHVQHALDVGWIEDAARRGLIECNDDGSFRLSRRGYKIARPLD